MLRQNALIGWVGLAVVLVLLAATAAAVTFQLSGPGNDVAPGEEFTLELRATSGAGEAGSFGYQVKVKYPVSGVTLVGNVAEGTALKAGGSTFFTTDTGAAGEVSLVSTLLGGSGVMLADDVLASMTFKADAPVSQATFTLSDAVASDSSANSLPVTALTGWTVNVVSCTWAAEKFNLVPDAPVNEINVFDLVAWVTKFLAFLGGVYDAVADFNGDGSIAVTDLVLMAFNFGEEDSCQGTGQPPAPQPARLVFTQPASGTVLTTSGGTATLDIAYTKSGDLAAAQVDHMHYGLQGIEERRDTDFDGAAQWTGLAPGNYTLYGYLARLDHSEVADTRVSVPFAVQAPQPPPAPGELTIGNVSAKSGKAYEAVENGLANGALIYIDRTYSFTDVPAELQGADYIKTANDDKVASDAEFLSFDVSVDATVYVLYDSRGTPPNWLSGWTATGQTVATNDASLKVFAKDFGQGSVVLGGNQATGASGAGSNYVVAALAGGTGPGPSTPRVNLTVSPGIVEAGASVTLNWSAENVSSCTASGGWSGAKGTNGTETVGPIDAGKTFTLTCTGDNGSASDTTAVSLAGQRPPTGSGRTIQLSADPGSEFYYQSWISDSQGQRTKPGDVLVLPAGEITGFNVRLHGTPEAWITIKGPDSGEPTRITPFTSICCNITEFREGKYIMMLGTGGDEGEGRGGIVIDGKGLEGPFGVSVTGNPMHSLRFEGIVFKDIAPTDPQTVAFSTKADVCNITVKNNEFRDVGLGFYWGNSDGSYRTSGMNMTGNRFTGFTNGYLMEVKHYNRGVPDIPNTPCAGTLLPNVISGNEWINEPGSNWERPNLLVGDQGPNQEYVIENNYFYLNDKGGECLFQGEGWITMRDNVFDNPVNCAILARNHNGTVQPGTVIENNTVISAEAGGGIIANHANATVRNNIVFADGTAINNGNQSNNFTAGYGARATHLVNPVKYGNYCLKNPSDPQLAGKGTRGRCDWSG